MNLVTRGHGRVVGALVLAGVVVACGGAVDGAAEPTARQLAPTPAAATETAAEAATEAVTGAASSEVATVTAAAAANGSCTTYATADPNRPALRGAMKIEGRVVTATLLYRFTPDLPVDQLVFRLWGQAPRVAAKGGKVEVGNIRVDGRPVNGNRQNATILRVPYRGPAGRRVGVLMDVRLTLPVGANDRLGARDGTRWFGSGLPLLAWERGVGWRTEPATALYAEATTSEVMRVDRLNVRRAPGLAAVMNGTKLADDGRTAVFTADKVRDVMIAVGRFKVATGLVIGRPFTVAVHPSMPDDPKAVLAELVRATRSHMARFGAFPFPQLMTVVVPDLSGGIEFPGGMLLGTGQHRDSTASHEVAHMWFYGMIGNSQARDPWLDEALATYAEALDRGTGDAYAQRSIPAAGRGRVGAAMTYWETHPGSYFRSVYTQGAVALLKARERAGAQAFDAAMRCFVRKQAQQIAVPNDLRDELAMLPGAVAALQEVGALPR